MEIDNLLKRYPEKELLYQKNLQNYLKKIKYKI